MSRSSPKVSGQYVDDTMVIIQSSAVETFSNHIRAQYPSIAFTRECKVNNQIPMLDTLITKELDGSLTFSIYRKKTHTDHYLQYDSHQPMEHKLGVIRTLTHRANTVCSTEKARQEELSHLKKVLSISKYPKWAWDAPGGKSKQPPPRKQTPGGKKGHITLPYIRGLSEALNRTIRKAGIQVHTRPINTLRGRLVSPKDKCPKLDTAGVVYHIKCANCPASYVGETERKLSKRVTEHKRDCEKSPVGAHMSEHQHQFQDCDVKVLHKEGRWFQRGVAEAIHIVASKPSLNRDRGRHTLPAIYTELVRSCDLGCHQGHMTS